MIAKVIVVFWEVLVCFLNYRQKQDLGIILKHPVIFKILDLSF